jgi:hypothetical protein
MTAKITEINKLSRLGTLGYFRPRWPTWRRFDPRFSPSAIDLGSLLSSAVDLPQNPQQTETFQVNDCTGDYRRNGNLRLETTFSPKLRTSQF